MMNAGSHSASSVMRLRACGLTGGVLTRVLLADGTGPGLPAAEGTGTGCGRMLRTRPGAASGAAATGCGPAGAVLSDSMRRWRVIGPVVAVIPEVSVGCGGAAVCCRRVTGPLRRG